MLFEERLLKRLREEKQQWEDLLLGDRYCIPDYATYRFYVGKIRGLAQAIQICVASLGKEEEEDGFADTERSGHSFSGR